MNSVPAIASNFFSVAFSGVTDTFLFIIFLIGFTAVCKSNRNRPEKGRLLIAQATACSTA